MFGPMLKAITGRSRATTRTHLVLVPVLCVGIASSFILFHTARARELERMRAEFVRASEDRVSGLTKSIRLHAFILESLASLYAASNQVERGEFRIFAAPFLSQHPGIQALEWIPRVADSERAAHEDAARKDSFRDYQITERNRQGHMARAARRDEYFPVCFVEPYESNEGALGFDLAANRTCRAALKRSCDTGQMVATARITQVQEAGRQFAYLAFLPLYEKGAQLDSVEGRRSGLAGFVLAVLRIGDIVGARLRALGAHGC